MRTYLEKNHLRCHLGRSVFNSVVTEFNLFKHDMKSPEFYTFFVEN